MHLLKQLFDFVLIYVIVRHIIANYVAKKLSDWFSKSERRALLWAHYQLQHENSIYHCEEGRCVGL